MSHPLPNSSGSGAPRLAVPPLACDAHMHIFDGRFACQGQLLDAATVADYRPLQQRLGTQRTVVVTPRIYGTDNRVTLDAIAQLGPAYARGVAVLNPPVSDAELQALHDGGIRGIRFTLYTLAQAATTFDMVEPLAARVHELGWHVQLHWTPQQIEAHAALLSRLPATLVFDHLARLGGPGLGPAHPAYAIVARLLEGGRAWVKLSGAYLDDEGPGYGSTDATARAFAALAPQRLVWGSDWPHSTEAAHKPDDATLMDLLLRWLDSAAARTRVLVDNPAQLYGFKAQP